MKSLELNKPHLLIVVGLPGSGKSFFASQFSGAFRTPYVDYGHYHRLTGSIETGDIVATELLGQLFLTRQTILIEGRGETAQDRQILAKLAKSKDYELFYVWVQTDPQTAYKRAVSGKDATYTEQEFDERSDSFDLLARGEKHAVISGRHTFPSQAKIVLRRLVTPRTAATVQPRPVPARGDSGQSARRTILR